MSYQMIIGVADEVLDVLNGAVVLGPIPREGLAVGGLTVIFTNPVATVTFAGGAGAVLRPSQIAAALLAGVSGLRMSLREGFYLSLWVDAGFTISSTGTANALLALSTTANTVSAGNVSSSRIKGFSQGATNGYYSLILS